MNQLYKQLSENQEYKTIVAKAKKRFGFKTFAQEFKSILYAATATAFFLPFISVLTGSFFLASVGELMLGSQWLAFICAIILVILGEFLKAISLKIGMSNLYEKGKWFLFLLPFAFTLGAGSVFISLQGAKAIHAKFNTIEQDHYQFQLAQQDSLIAYYEQQKLVLDKEKEEYSKSVSWKGKIDMYNSANKAFFESHSARVKALETEKQERLHALEKRNTEKAVTLKSDFQLHESVVLGMILSIELFILIANWFIVFYDYMAYKEDQTLKEPAPVTVKLSEVQELISSFLIGNHDNTQLVLNEGTTIGFQSSLSSDHSVEKNRADSGKNEGSLSDGTTLREDIRNGLRDYRTLSRKHKVNFNVIKKAIDEHDKLSKL